jgi:hypothetical protein
MGGPSASRTTSLRCGDPNEDCPLRPHGAHRARIWLGRLLAIQPRYTIAEYMRLTTYFPPEIQAIYVEGFRKAGMPEE